MPAECLAAPGVVHQNTSHLEGSKSDKPALVAEVHMSDIQNANQGLMHQCGRLQGVGIGFVAHEAARNPAQLGINRIEHLRAERVERSRAVSVSVS